MSRDVLLILDNTSIMFDMKQDILCKSDIEEYHSMNVLSVSFSLLFTGN